LYPEITVALVKKFWDFYTRCSSVGAGIRISTKNQRYLTLDKNFREVSAYYVTISARSSSRLRSAHTESWESSGRGLSRTHTVVRDSLPFPSHRLVVSRAYAPELRGHAENNHERPYHSLLVSHGPEKPLCRWQRGSRTWLRFAPAVAKRWT
jgi:hypothetical protein